MGGKKGYSGEELNNSILTEEWEKGRTAGNI